VFRRDPEASSVRAAFRPGREASSRDPEVRTDRPAADDRGDHRLDRGDHLDPAAYHRDPEASFVPEAYRLGRAAYRRDPEA
jgi:hypothetical protein